MRNKIIIAITGASGSIYAKVLIKKILKIKSDNPLVEIALVMSKNAMEVWQHELQNEEFKNFPIPFFHNNDFKAPFASGSSQYNTMIIIPCSMGTLGRIATGTSNNLLTRSADVILKERRKLICVVRDTPYNLIHIENMRTITLAGGIICPATPSFYSHPKTIEDIASTVVDRVLDLTGLSIKTFRWGEKL